MFSNLLVKIIFTQNIYDIQQKVKAFKIYRRNVTNYCPKCKGIVLFYVKSRCFLLYTLYTTCILPQEENSLWYIEEET